MKITKKQLIEIINNNLLSEMPYEPIPMPTGGPEGPKFPSPDAGPDRKYRREQEKRQLIKRKLKQKGGGFLDSRVEELKSVRLGYPGDGKRRKHAAVGYATDSRYNKGKQIAVFLAEKAREKQIKLYYNGGKIEKGHQIKVTNLGGLSIGTFTQHDLSKITKPNAKILMYVPSDEISLQEIQKKNQYSALLKISFSSELVSLGLASGADWAIETLTVLGAIPGIGNAADAAAVSLAISKEPPDYLLAALSALCMLPVIGIGAALARPLFKKLTGKGGKEAAKKAVEFVKAQTGKNLANKATIRKMRQQANKLYDELMDERRLARLTLLSNRSADKLSQGLAKSKEVLDELINNLEFVGKSSKKGLDDLTKASARRAAARVIREIQAGTLRDACSKFAKEIAKKSPFKSPPYWPADLIGRKFYHDQTGKEIVFKSMNDFGNTYIAMCKQIGIPEDKAAKMFATYYQGVRKIPDTLEPVQIDQAVDMLTKELKNVKIKVVNDKSMLKAADDLEDSVRGFYRLDENAVYINMSSFTKDGTVAQIKDTVEHELIHAIDKQMLVILAGGQRGYKAIREKFGYHLASDSLRGTAFRTSRGAKVERYVTDAGEISNIIKNYPTNLDGLTNWQYFNVKGGFTAKQVAYLSDPAEMFVRVQRISYWLKREGLRANDWDEFFKLSYKEMIDEVPDADLFLHIKDIFNKKDRSDFYKKTHSDLVDLFNKLLGM